MRIELTAYTAKKIAVFTCFSGGSVKVLKWKPDCRTTSNLETIFL